MLLRWVGIMLAAAAAVGTVAAARWLRWVLRDVHGHVGHVGSPQAITLTPTLVDFTGPG